MIKADNISKCTAVFQRKKTTWFYTTFILDKSHLTKSHSRKSVNNSMFCMHLQHEILTEEKNVPVPKMKL